MVSRVVGLEAHWTPRGYVLDQARLRPHESSASTSGFIYLTIRSQPCLNGFFPNKGLDASRKLRHYSVVNTSSRKPHGPLSLRASWHLPSRPYRTRDRCSRLARSRYHYFRGSPHHRIRIWSDSCVGRPSARSDFWRSHQPSDNSRPHHRRKDSSGHACSIHFRPSARRNTRRVHVEIHLWPIRIPRRPRHHETGYRREPFCRCVTGDRRDIRAGDVRIRSLITSSQEAGRSCAHRSDSIRHYSRAGSANERIAQPGSKSRTSTGVRIFDESLRLLDWTLGRGFNCRTRIQVHREIQNWPSVPYCLSVLRTRDEARWPRPSPESMD